MHTPVPQPTKTAKRPLWARAVGERRAAKGKVRPCVWEGSVASKLAHSPDHTAVGPRAPLAMLRGVSFAPDALDSLNPPSTKPLLVDAFESGLLTLPDLERAQNMDTVVVDSVIAEAEATLSELPIWPGRDPNFQAFLTHEYPSMNFGIVFAGERHDLPFDSEWVWVLDNEGDDMLRVLPKALHIRSYALAAWLNAANHFTSASLPENLLYGLPDFHEATFGSVDEAVNDLMQMRDISREDARDFVLHARRITRWGEVSSKVSREAFQAGPTTDLDRAVQDLLALAESVHEQLQRKFPIESLYPSGPLSMLEFAPGDGMPFRVERAWYENANELADYQMQAGEPVATVSAPALGPEGRNNGIRIYIEHQLAAAFFYRLLNVVKDLSHE